jgi:hypothetical protein
MATIQFAQAACEVNTYRWPVNRNQKRKPPLSMNWVVVTDENGERQLRMRWKAERNA